MRSRASPKSLYNAIKNMTAEQKQKLRDIGFGSIIEIKFSENPMKISYFVVNNFDENSSSLKLKNGSIKITEKTVFEILGVPLGGTKIESLDRSDPDDPVTTTWKSQFHKQGIRSKDVMQYMKDRKEVDRLFVLNFLVIFATCMAEGTKLGTCNLKFLPFITPEVDVSKLNWCGYIYECLIQSKSKWKRGAHGEYYCGPLTFLIVS